MTDGFIAERGPLMAELRRLLAEAAALDDAGQWREAIPLLDRVTEIDHLYRDLLPEVTVARCPDSGTPVRWPIDTAGLDGRFWDYETPVRRLPRDLPVRWLTMTGAVRLSTPVEFTPYLAVPGPGAPFVVPRILRSPGVRAVIAQVPVGTHTGWAISYFGPRPKGIRLVNLWGTNTYPVYDENGKWLGWGRDFNVVSEYDFALADWLRSGQLLWIAPGDESGTLREGVDGCPYLDLPGNRRIAIVEEGEIRYFD
jgi:hypothetical protein